jgi:hypothetical protein
VQSVGLRLATRRRAQWRDGRARRSGVTRGRIETESGNNGDDGPMTELGEIAPVQVTRGWVWPWKRRAGRQAVEEYRAFRDRALRAEKQAVRERKRREAIERVKVKEVLREKTDLYERIEALEAELEEHPRNPG